MTIPADIPPHIMQWAADFWDAHIDVEEVEMVARAFLAGQASVSAPDRGGLTDRQRQALHILEEQVDLTGGTPPSIRELADRLGCAPSRAHSVVKQLEQRGFIASVPNAARSISIVGRAA